jgi:hypothetical protein
MPMAALTRTYGGRIGRLPDRAASSEREDEHGHLVYHPGGAWGFHYDRDVKLPEDFGYHFADEHFVTGEYVSINESGKMHTYRVASVSRL